MPRHRILAVALAATVVAATLPAASVAQETIDVNNHIPQDQLEAQIERFAAVDVAYDEDVLSEPERTALAKLVQVAGIMDDIFLGQVWEGNYALRKDLVYAMGSDAENKAVMKDLYHFFRINFGPWNRLEHNQPFVGNRAKPDGAGYYPTDMTKAEFEKHIEAHPEDRDAFTGYFTKIERAEDGTLVAVPYNEAYKKDLSRAAKLMREAADILTAPESKKKIEGADYATLANFLRSRAAAFESNDYFQSDMDWMDVENNIIDVTIGPYEVYEDNLFAYKAAFEAFIAIRHPADSKKLADLKHYLPAMERNLPIPDEHKNLDRGTDSPISVVDVVFIGGDSKAGVQTIAFNLPNDERVREAKGSKKVMLKNISWAKYEKILTPIADIVLAKEQREQVNFDSYFSNVLMHELAHGLGPGTITLADGTETTVNQVLKTLYSPLEEAKADIMGLYNKTLLVKEGYITQEELEKSYVCFLPGFFRAIRFGVHEAHGKANMIEYNYLLEKGAISLDADTDRYTVHFDKMPAAVEGLTHDLCMIQALGDYQAAEAFLEKYGHPTDEVLRMIEKMTDIPTDIEPQYRAAKYLDTAMLGGEAH
jgi:hypothetical protein